MTDADALAALERRLAAAEAILRALEWSGRRPADGENGPSCLVCKRFHWQCHADDCPFRQLPEG